jgi:hypothetical protein
MQPEGTRVNCFSACFSRRPRQGDNLPERVKADGNEDVYHRHCTIKATEPYGIAEVARRSRDGGIVRLRKHIGHGFLQGPADNPSVSLTADSSLYTREPFLRPANGERKPPLARGGGLPQGKTERFSIAALLRSLPRKGGPAKRGFSCSPSE